jgi:dihydropteroate synthase
MNDTETETVKSVPAGLGETSIGPATFAWGSRTFVMGIVNVTPDSFSGDGLLDPGATEATASVAAAVPGARASASLAAKAVALARTMAEEGADLLDVGGESTRPGHTTVDTAEEIQRVVPIVAAIRAALPSMPISIDTTKPAVAAAAIDAGADLINDIWGVGEDDALVRFAAERRVPIVLMHNRAEPRYRDLMAEVADDLERAIERALRVGVAWSDIVVDPGFGFGKTPEHNLVLVRELDSLRRLGRPVLLGASRKSTLGMVLHLPADERLEATIATTVLGIAGGADIVRVHDVKPNVRAARMTDAVLR